MAQTQSMTRRVPVQASSGINELVLAIMAIVIAAALTVPLVDLMSRI